MIRTRNNAKKVGYAAASNNSTAAKPDRVAFATAAFTTTMKLPPTAVDCYPRCCSSWRALNAVFCGSCFSAVKAVAQCPGSLYDAQRSFGDLYEKRGA